MLVIDSFDSSVVILQKIFVKRFKEKFSLGKDQYNNCEVVTITLNKRNHSIKFEGIVIAYVKEFLPHYDIYQIIKKSNMKIMIFYPEEFC